MKKYYTDKKVESLQELIDFLDKAKNKKETYEDVFCFCLNGTEIDVLKLIERYGLKHDTKSDSIDGTYGQFTAFPQFQKNTYCVGPKSQYGHIPYSLNIKGYGVFVKKNSRTKYETYSSTTVNKLKRTDNYVVVDIETTGLNPIFDDIIQICVYENKNKYTLRYLPLEKKTTNTAYGEYNSISDEMLKFQSPITQNEVDAVLERFDLENRVVVIWSGKDYFDRTFLETYFYQHGLKGLEKIKFFSGISLLDEIKDCEIKSRSKDSIAYIYGIDTTNSHNALTDCEIEYQIVENLLNKNYSPFFEQNHFSDLILNIYRFLISEDNSHTAKEYYEKLCCALTLKNGKVSCDYDKKTKKRGDEWIDIHHIDETELDNIATRTEKAKIIGDKTELEFLAPYNKKERLVYATKVEHFILHCLIYYYHFKPSYGPHWLFGEIMKIEIGDFAEGKKEYNIKKRKKTFYHEIGFDQIKKIYAGILSLHGLKMYQLKKYHKIEEYKYNEKEYKELRKELNQLCKTATNH